MKQLQFKIEGQTLKCKSPSGSTYQLSKTICTCKGFGFRRKCRHMDAAINEGLISKLEAQQKKGTVRSQSPKFVEMRINAIKLFLDKNQVKHTKSLLKKMEKVVTMKMSSKQFLNIARRGK